MHACLSMLFVLLLAPTAFAVTNEEAIAAFQQGKAAMERMAPQEAIPHFRKALEICTELSIDPCRAVNLSELGNAYAIQGRYSEALPAFQEILAIRKRTGASAEMLIRGLNDVGMTQYAMKMYPEALASFEEGLVISRGRNISGATAMLLEGAGMARFARHDLEGALAAFEESLKLQKEMGYPSDETVRNINNIGTVYLSGGHYGKALPYLQEAVDMLRRQHVPDMTATGLNNLGYALAQLNMHEKAMANYEEALAMRRKMNTQAETATVLNNMGLLLVSMGRHSDALARHREALALRKSVGDSQAVAESLSNIGFADYYAGAYDEAMKYFDEALKIYEGLKDKRTLSIGLNNMAAVYDQLGRFDKALQCHERSLQLRRELNIPVDIAVTLNNIGQSHLNLGQYDRAISYFTESLAIKQKHGLAAASVAITLNNLGVVYDAIGQPESSLNYYQQALAINRQHNQPRAAGGNLANIGMSYLAMKKYPEAERSFIAAEQEMNSGERKVRGNPGLVELYLATSRYDKAFGMLKKMSPDWMTDDANRMQFHTQMGEALKGLGRLSEATGELLQAVAISENMRRAVGERGGYFAGGYAGGRVRPYRLLLSVLCERTLKGETKDARLVHLGRDMAESAFRVAELIKSRNLLESMAESRRGKERRQLPSDLKIRETSLLNRLAALDEQWETAVKSGEAAISAYNRSRGKLYADFLGLIKLLRSRYPRYAAIYYPDAVAASALPLAPGETVLEYAYGHNALYLFVVRKGGVKSVVRIPVPPAEIEKRIQSFMEPLYANRPDEFSEKLARELGDTLMAAAQFSIKEGNRVIIVPDGMLGLLPFGALRPATVNSGDNPPYLDERWLISYEHSASTLALNRLAQHKKAARALFAIANPVFDELDPRNSALAQAKPVVQVTAGQVDGFAFRGLSVQAKTAASGAKPVWNEVVYPPLPETETEVRKIAATLGVKPVPPDILLGLDARKDNLLKARLGEYRFLHFATHADLPGKLQGVGEPFILLGQIGLQPNSDGFLRLSEILELQLHADMVMLSACDTGRGDLVAGEGVANLARAFQHAGASSVISSLWQVASQPAVEYMTLFYGHLKKGNDRALALSQARREMKKKYPSPYYWAVFAFYGEAA